MPIYEYACPDCGHGFEVLQKFSDDPVRVCPSCSKENVRKKISATSFVLKGGGWYTDHYGLKSGSASASEGGGSGSDGGASSGGGSSSDGSPGSAGAASGAGSSSPASGSGPAAPAAPASTTSTTSSGS
jgi:putative FmdB family regulatory protein